MKKFFVLGVITACVLVGPHVLAGKSDKSEKRTSGKSGKEIGRLQERINELEGVIKRLHPNYPPDNDPDIPENAQVYDANGRQVGLAPEGAVNPSRASVVFTVIGRDGEERDINASVTPLELSIAAEPRSINASEILAYTSTDCTGEPVKMLRYPFEGYFPALIPDDVDALAPVVTFDTSEINTITDVFLRYPLSSEIIKVNSFFISGLSIECINSESETLWSFRFAIPFYSDFGNLSGQDFLVIPALNEQYIAPFDIR